ncbi:MAG: hypothetical protein ACKN9T_04345 [Candidatus Methylumidiphilus sp.]
MTNKTIKVLGFALVAGMLAIGTVSTSYAAENSAGVAEFLDKSADSAKKALEELQGGRADETITELKKLRQFTKEITGQAASIKLQRVNQSVKETIRILEEEKDNKKALDVLAPAVQSMQEINAESKKR